MKKTESTKNVANYVILSYRMFYLFRYVCVPVYIYIYTHVYIDHYIIYLIIPLSTNLSLIHLANVNFRETNQSYSQSQTQSPKSRPYFHTHCQVSSKHG